ncbi:MAG: prepilin-type N-terminal cleavage/methylation domain-containing protein [Desulfocapsaceae bacterium]|nr:prepilin-type N-terminal cleavage/methylation domain-containing protein [Desulfocapsaceae bacterium]
MKIDGGFTVIEAMTAVFILAVGMLAAAGMQIRAIGATSNGMTRTLANAMALSIMEELKRIPFDDPRLIDRNGKGTAGLNDGAGIRGETVMPERADHQFSPDNFPNFINTYKVMNGDITDGSGRAYQIFWNIDKSPLDAGHPPAFCRISLFVYWRTPMGQQHLQLTGLRHNNSE